MFVFLFALLPLAAQQGKDFEDYNVKRGFEMLQNDEDQGEALKQFETALEKNPRNGYAHFFIGLIRLDNDENGNALSAIDQALKYLPKKDKETLALAHSKRALVHLALADTTAALTDIGTAIRLAPDDRDYIQQRGDLYYEMERYDLSDRDYEQMQKLDKGNTYSYMGMGATQWHAKTTTAPSHSSTTWCNSLPNMGRAIPSAPRPTCCATNIRAPVEDMHHSPLAHGRRH